MPAAHDVRSIVRRFWLALLPLLVLTACVQRGPRIAPLETYDSAVLTIQVQDGPQPRYEVLQVTDPQQVQQLIAFFPGLAKAGYSKPEGRLSRPLVIHFENGVDEAYRITSDYQTWSWGEGPVPVRGDLAAYVNELRQAPGS